MYKKRLFILYLLVTLTGACTKSLQPIVDQAKSPQPTVHESLIREPLFGKPYKDEELFIRGLHQLADPANENEYVLASHTLETLLNSYPDSKWRDAARAALRLIGEMNSYREKLRTEQDMAKKLLADKTITIQENELLKKELRLLNEKYQSEVAALQQENEQLKGDLQLLKNLELQLDKREKLLR
ncbi:MAG TPA: hypothetical protein VJZ49_03765 [Syntrophales bacterium]|nr:hypothetical protein [Syntrophales bacterium]